jgi:hypothetical protein
MKEKNIITKANKESRPEGKRSNVAKWIRKANRKEYLNNNIYRKLNQMKALIQGKNVMLSIRNTNNNETNKKFIRVNARDVWLGATKTYVMKTKD